MYVLWFGGMYSSTENKIQVWQLCVFCFLFKTKESKEKKKERGEALLEFTFQWPVFGQFFFLWHFIHVLFSSGI